MIVFITGGAKNGKSSLAQNLAVKLAGGGKRYYIATMIPSDQEDRDRIRRHIADRDGMGFETVEQGRDIAKVLTKADPNGSFLLDSVTALLLNELFPDPTSCEMDEDAADRCEKGLGSLCDRASNLVLVSSLSRSTRDIAFKFAMYPGFTRSNSLLSSSLDIIKVTDFGSPRSSGVTRLNRPHSSFFVSAQYSVSSRRIKYRIFPLRSGIGYPVSGSIHHSMNLATQLSASGLQEARTKGFTPQVLRFRDSI